MSQKVVSIAVGEAHTLALTGDGSIYSWGRGMFGRLGTGKEADELSPVRVSFQKTGNQKTGNLYPELGESNQPKFVGIATGSYHSLALQDDGSVWSWGYNTYGQLGFGDEEENSLIPCLVPALTNQNNPPPLKITAVKAGGMMSFAIDNLGSLWMWGQCPSPTNSDAFRLVSIPAPIPVFPFHGHKVVKISCGNEHILACVSTQEFSNLVLYSWGGNTHGQLGLGHREAQPSPVVVPAFNAESSWEVYEIACGAFHSAALAQKKTSDELQCRCWTFGLGDNGQLGHGTTNGSDLPVPVITLPSEAFLISLDCGLFHTAVLSADGDVWRWGMEKGLGLCPDATFSGLDPGDALNPLRVMGSESNGFPGPVQIGCGAAHTVLVAGDGYKMWAWGRGRSGVLGKGDGDDSFTPVPVAWPPVEKFDAGNGICDDSNGGRSEMEMKLEEVMERMKMMERYANILHISIFRKPMEERRVKESIHGSGVFDMRREFEGLLEKADGDELARMEMFYKGVLASVKEEGLKRRVNEMVRQSLGSLRRGN